LAAARVLLTSLLLGVLLTWLLLGVLLTSLLLGWCSHFAAARVLLTRCCSGAAHFAAARGALTSLLLGVLLIRCCSGAAHFAAARVLLTWLLLGVLLTSLLEGTLLSSLLFGALKPYVLKWLIESPVMVNVPSLLNVNVEVTFPCGLKKRPWCRLCNTTIPLHPTNWGQSRRVWQPVLGHCRRKRSNLQKYSAEMHRCRRILLGALFETTMSALS
jgi:hypothetical protein